MSMDNFMLWAFLTVMIFKKLKIYLWRFMPNLKKKTRTNNVAKTNTFQSGPYEKYGFHYIDIHGTQDL
jgi:hypothetical protein